MALHGWLNHVILQAVEHFPAFAFHARSKAEIENVLNHYNKIDWTYLSLDGSRHDAHQHEILMGSENWLFQVALRRFFRYSGLPTAMYRVLMASICNTRFRVKLP